MSMIYPKLWPSLKCRTFSKKMAKAAFDLPAKLPFTPELRAWEQLEPVLTPGCDL